MISPELRQLMERWHDEDFAMEADGTEKIERVERLGIVVGHSERRLIARTVRGRAFPKMR